MDAEGWQASIDPGGMLRALHQDSGTQPIFPTARAERLAACGCVRVAAWPGWTSDTVLNRCEAAAEGICDLPVEGSEPFTLWPRPQGKQLGGWKLSIVCAHQSALLALERVVDELNSLWTHPREADSGDPLLPPCQVADVIRDVLGNPYMQVRVPEKPECPTCYGKGKWGWGTYDEEFDRRVAAGEPTEGEETCSTCHGSGQVKTRQEMLTPTVRDLAEGIYQARAWEQLPILADALEDAGCAIRPLLDHLRQPLRPRHAFHCPCGGMYAPLKKDFLPLLSMCVRCHRDGPFWACLVAPPGAVHVRGCWALEPWVAWGSRNNQQEKDQR